MATSKPIRTASEILAIGHKNAKEARERIDNNAATTPTQMYLPGMDEAMRAMPNHVARSSLFAPVGRGRKKQHAGTKLVSRADASIQYWGEQLDEAQADVYMQVMYEATKHPLGEPFVINVAAFLRAMGRSTSGRDYEWLFKAMRAMSIATLVIETHRPNGHGGYKLAKPDPFTSLNGLITTLMPRRTWSRSTHAGSAFTALKNSHLLTGKSVCRLRKDKTWPKLCKG